jgi:hypothetical protein
MAFGQIQSINGVDHLLRDWISNMFCDCDYSRDGDCNCKCNCETLPLFNVSFKFLRGAIPQCNSGVRYQANYQLDVDCF